MVERNRCRRGRIIECRGDYADYGRLLKLTAGLPLYVQNALKIAAGSYEGDIIASAQRWRSGHNCRNGAGTHPFRRI